MSRVAAWLLIGLCALPLLALAVWSLAMFFDLVARCGRFVSYRRSYPSAPRSKVWRHVR